MMMKKHVQNGSVLWEPETQVKTLTGIFTLLWTEYYVHTYNLQLTEHHSVSAAAHII